MKEGKGRVERLSRGNSTCEDQTLDRTQPCLDDTAGFVAVLLILIFLRKSQENGVQYRHGKVELIVFM